MIKNKFCVIILARGGSKGIKNKNIVLIKKKPLLYYPLKAANNSPKIQKIFLSTDSKLIKKTVENLNFTKVKVIDRSIKNSRDSSTSEDAILEFIKNINYENIFFIQATNVFLNTTIINKAISHFINKGFDSLLSVIEGKNFSWMEKNNKFKAINYDYMNRPLRQKNKKKYYIENGSFYIFKKKGFIKNKNRLYGKIGFFEMNQKSYFDIDDYEDLNIVKKLL